MDEPGRVTIVPNEVAADVVCSFLRAEGIRCDHRVTNIGAGAWDGVPNAGWRRARCSSTRPISTQAREALAAAELGEFSPEGRAVAERWTSRPGPLRRSRRRLLADRLLVVAAELLAHRRQHLVREVSPSSRDENRA